MNGILYLAGHETKTTDVRLYTTVYGRLATSRAAGWRVSEGRSEVSRRAAESSRRHSAVSDMSFRQPAFYSAPTTIQLHLVYAPCQTIVKTSHNTHLTLSQYFFIKNTERTQDHWQQWDSVWTFIKRAHIIFSSCHHCSLITINPLKGKANRLHIFCNIATRRIRIKWKSCRESYALINMELECDPNREGKTATMQTGVVSNCRACKHIKGRRANDA